MKLETARIESVGGWVKGGRVCDMLAVTRAFGDAEFKGDENRAQMLQDGIRFVWRFPVHSINLSACTSAGT